MAKRLFSGLSVGVVAGATAGLLLAPKPGKVTRRFARQRGAKYVEEVKERINRGTSKGTA
jgi:gas vesicle protein